MTGVSRQAVTIGEMLESNGIGFQFVHTDLHHKRPLVPHDALPIDETSLALP